MQAKGKESYNEILLKQSKSPGTSATGFSPISISASLRELTNSIRGKNLENVGALEWYDVAYITYKGWETKKDETFVLFRNISKEIVLLLLITI